jgi:hypothetical protein
MDLQHRIAYNELRRHKGKYVLVALIKNNKIVWNDKCKIEVGDEIVKLDNLNIYPLKEALDISEDRYIIVEITANRYRVYIFTVTDNDEELILMINTHIKL